MMRRLSVIALACAGLVGLAACGQKAQENATGQAIKNDVASYAGVGKSQYAQGGWTAGDRSSWEQQLKARTQHGQNDYQRIGAQPK
jgi:opacity protein-like surface antigen